ncbi:MAG: DNA polymerase III subunit delta [Oscillospiraceae bacterium]|nr:DNA polymerase III subunit delta [Oscillospiraceae bacterium]
MAKKQADHSAYQKLKKDIAAQTLGRLYVLHGEESYLRDYYLGRMKEQLLGDGMADFNLHTVTGADFSAAWLEQAVDCLPMMSQRTMILISDVEFPQLGEREKERLCELLGQLPDYCCVIFLFDAIDYKLDARSKLAGAFKRNGEIVEFARQGQSDLEDWVYRRFRALGKQIDAKLAGYLIFQCGELMNTLVGEIEKISAYAKGERITQQDIDAVVTPELDAISFQMTDAIGTGDFDKAAQVLGELLEMREPSVKVVAALGSQMRKLYSARLLLDAHGSAGDLAQLWGMNPGYPSQKLMNSARRFSPEWCRKAVIACARADLALKSDNGRGDREVMTDLLLELSTPAKGN